MYSLQLKSLDLERFRIFQNLSINFHPQLTILLGENGAGKTTILDAIAKLLEIYVQKMQHPSTNSDFLETIYIDEDINNNATDALCKIELFFLDDSNALKRIDKKRRSTKRRPRNQDIQEIENTENGSIESKDHFENETDLPKDTVTTQEYYTIYWQNVLRRQNYLFGEEFSNLDLLDDLVHTLNLQLQDKSSENVSLPLVVYYPCHDTQFNATNGITPTYQRNDIFNALDHALSGKPLNFNYFFEWFKWQENLARQTDSKRLLEIVTNAVLSMLNDPTTTPIYSKLRTNWIDTPRGELIIDKNGSDIKVAQLSSGEKRLLSLVADLARRLAIANPSLDNPLRGNGIVLIDEIEQHLHPRWQRVVLLRLQNTFPNCQFVVTTHSPQVLQNADRENIQVISDGALLDHQPYVKGRDSNAVLHDAFGVSQTPIEQDNLLQKLDDCYDLIDNDQIEAAQKILAELKEVWGKYDKNIVELRTTIDLAKYDTE